MVECYCGSKNEYSFCCEPFITGNERPTTLEVLMRSRYTAYCLANINYIQQTMRGRALIYFDAMDAKRWANRVHWIKLEVLNKILDNPHKGYVEFIATFVDNCHLKSIHEKSEFIQEDGRWYYVDGVQFPLTESTSKSFITRNSLCPCGSQRKFKNCHGKR